MRRTDHLARAPLGSTTSRRSPGRAPAAARVHTPRRPAGYQRDWARINAGLVRRGDVTIYLDPTTLQTPRTGRGGRYPRAVITLMCVLAAVYGTPLRQTQGLTQGLLQLSGLTGVQVPDYTTLSRRRKAVTFIPPTRTGPVVIAIDATGVTLCSPGEWTRNTYGDTRKATFVKLHGAVDVHTGQLHAAVVTDSSGRGTGDVSVGPVLIRDTAAGGPVTATLADQAYDARSCWEAARDAGGVLRAVPKNTAVRGLHPDRDVAITQIGRLGAPTWRVRVGYGDRAHVEGAWSAVKRTLGHRSRARSFAGAVSVKSSETVVVSLFGSRSVRAG
jgi:hypothetical protein